MDWTGGAKRRFANRKNDSILQRQRAHFAKVRAAAALASSSKTQVHSEEHVVEEASLHVGRPQSQYHDQNILHDLDQTFGHSHEQDNNDFHSERQRKARKPSKHSRNSQDASSQEATPSDSRKDLLACRRRLQPQNDWLGLAAARPVQMSFKDAQEKEKIGHRRRVERPGVTEERKRSKRHVQERIQRPFEGVGPFMTGALPASDQAIEIKIGTGAFSSQIQPSHRTHTPVTTHLYHISTPSSQLPEETMLLDYDTGSTASQHDTRDIPVATIERDSIASGRPNLESELSQFRNTPLESDSSLPWRSPAVRNRGNRNSEGEVGTESATGLTSEDGAESTELRHRAQLERDQCIGSEQGHTDVQTANTQEKHDEEAWRRFMHIKKYPPSKASVMALPSSSQHDSDPTELFPHQGARASGDGFGHTTATGQPGLEATRSRSTIVPSMATGHSVRSGTTSASLLKVRRLCQPQAPESRSKGGDAADEEIWRRFVIGSDESDASSPKRVYVPKIVRSSEERFIVEDVSDQDSDRATVATSVFPRNGHSKWNKERILEIYDDDGSASSAQGPISVVAHASMPSRSVLSEGSSSSHCAVSRKRTQRADTSMPRSREGRKRQRR